MSEVSASIPVWCQKQGAAEHVDTTTGSSSRWRPPRTCFTMLKRAMPPVSTSSSSNAAAMKKDAKGNIPSVDHALEADGRGQTGMCTELNTAKHRTEHHLRVPVEILRVRVLQQRGASVFPPRSTLGPASVNTWPIILRRRVKLRVGELREGQRRQRQALHHDQGKIMYGMPARSTPGKGKHAKPSSLEGAVYSQAQARRPGVQHGRNPTLTSGCKSALRCWQTL